MTQALTQKETIIIDRIKFFLRNFLDQDDNKRKDYYVHAYTNDYKKHDSYTILIYETEDDCVIDYNNPLLKLTINSRGIDWEVSCQQNAISTYIGNEVHNILFSNKDKRMIKGYYINTTSGEIEIVGTDKTEQPEFVLYEVVIQKNDWPEPDTAQHQNQDTPQLPL